MKRRNIHTGNRFLRDQIKQSGKMMKLISIVTL